MRFFSNDARESAEDQNPDDRSPEQRAQDEQALNDRALTDQGTNDQPDRVQSEPVAVPNQRAGSPWSDAPAEPGADRRDDVTEPVAGRDDTDPQPSAFGTAGDRRDETGRSTDADGSDGVVTSSTSTYSGSTVTAPDTVPATWSEKRDNEPDEIVDVPLDDQPASARATDGSAGLGADQETNHDDAVTTFGDETKDDTVRDDAVRDDAVRDDAVRDDTVKDEAVKDDAVQDDTVKDDLKDDVVQDEGTFDDPKAVDPATDQPLDSTVDADDTKVDDVPVVAAVPVAAAAPAAASTTLFDKDDATGFQERWRDVQLRFVDSPKEAAGDAAKLVEEAVEKLTTALRSQREGLHADTDDTEQLRVQLRGYRDMLNRIIGL